MTKYDGGGGDNDDDAAASMRTLARSLAVYVSRLRAFMMALFAGCPYLLYRSRCDTVTRCECCLSVPTLMTTVLGDTRW